MLENIKRKLTSDSVTTRIMYTYIIFLIIFFVGTTLSYYLLPEGFLRNKHPLQKWDTDPSLIISTIQILSYNLISVVALLFANSFSSRRKESQSFMPLGYIAFFAMITINSVVLGTWSFSVVTDPVPLVGRYLRTFDLMHRAGLWEMSGQLLIVCATAKSSMVIMDGKETITRKWKEIKISRQETVVITIGLALMLIGAFVESVSIINLG